jgi:hypothetical protein
MQGWVVVSVLNDVHDCTSSGRSKTSIPTSTWVAYKALPISVRARVESKEIIENIARKVQM